jgi:hypothetical protein
LVCGSLFIAFLHTVKPSVSRKKKRVVIFHFHFGTAESIALNDAARY